MIATLLRRVANCLDAPVKLEPITPLEFIPTAELAQEIRRRSDASLILWAKDLGSSDEVMVCCRMSREDLPAAIAIIKDAVRNP